MKNQICILVVDNHTVERKGLGSLLNEMPSIEVVGEAANGAEAALMARESRPDIVLIDQQILQKEGPGPIWRIWQDRPNTAILLLCQTDVTTATTPDLDSGRLWFTPKDCKPEELAQAIREIAFP